MIPQIVRVYLLPPRPQSLLTLSSRGPTKLNAESDPKMTHIMLYLVELSKKIALCTQWSKLLR